jgi:uracil-DNA glycosylase family 4
MSDSYHELLDATIEYLRDLQREGERWIPVRAEVLEALSAPVTRAQCRTVPARTPPAAPAPPPPPAEPVLIPSTPALAPAPAPLSAVEKAAAMAELRERTRVCQKCPALARSRQNVVFGIGDINASLMFVGEAPGADEDVQGEPFVGPAGQLLTRIIKTMGFTRETVYIANVLKCRPDTPGQSYGNRKPTAVEMKTCLPYLMEQIRLIQPKVIVALGATAMEGLLGKVVAISKLRGHWQTFHGIPVMPTYHPSYLLRNQVASVKREVWQDMLQVLERLGAPISEKQRNYFK